jgi:hypothetical protein
LSEALTEYVDHYHADRCHQGVGNVPIGLGKMPKQEGICVKVGVVCEQWLRGLLKHCGNVA